MAFHIRHGSPGSYKTAAAVWIDILEWLRQGRVVYTNIRGMLSVPEIEDALGLKETELFPPGAEIIAVDTDSHEARHHFACWFHWLPLGAALCIDEGQFIYPPRRDFKPETLDYPGGLDAATEAQRPADIFTAVDKHRHYNWDVCVTTPKLSKLPTWLTGVVEACYHHKNMEHIPIFGKRKARIHKHDASTTGTSINKQSQYELRRIPVEVHRLYGSTLTGNVTKNVAEQNPFKNPRLMSHLGLAILAVGVCVWLVSSLVGDDEIPGNAVAGVSDTTLAVEAVDRGAAGSAVVTAGPGPWSRLSAHLPGLNGLFIAGHWTTSQGTGYLYRYVSETGSGIVSGQYLADAGFLVTIVNDCAHDVRHAASSESLRVLCQPQRGRGSEPSERGSAVADDNGEPLFNPGMSSITPLGYSVHANG